MKVYPNKIKEREELKLRQGIKSSLPEIKALISLLLVLYEINDRNAVISYNEEVDGSTKIKGNYITEIERFFAKQSTAISSIEFLNELNNNPLCVAQLEALQVSLQLFFKFCSIDFVASLSNTHERTGGLRFAKKIIFSTNLDLFHLVTSEPNNQMSELTKNILWNWLTGRFDFVEDELMLNRIREFLTIISEETQFKIRKYDNQELYFQQEGIYQVMLDGSRVVEKDSHESVGPFRIFKSFLNKDLHAYLQETKKGIERRTKIEELENYLQKVSTTLDLIPRRITIIQDEITDSSPSINFITNITPKQKIYFGSPGTGKSTALQNFVVEHGLEVVRTTFHPDTDYYSFVGGYKPVMKGDAIVYQFVPQAFIKAYVKAYQNPDRSYLLAIEEINRGNCAQIFGDLFQCLDRNAEGFSCYPIEANTDLVSYLTSEGLANPEQIILPPNLLIYATMNTSDQSLFPMDAAFKRRWDWEYVPIQFDEKAAAFKILFDTENQYAWRSFVETVNKRITEITKSEDKKIGVYFVVPTNGMISLEQFKNKVMFYLWSEIFKDEHSSEDSIFKYLDEDGNALDFTFNELFESDGLAKLKGFMNYLEIALV